MVTGELTTRKTLKKGALTFTFASATARMSLSCGGLTPQGGRPTEVGSEHDQENFKINCKVDGQPVEVTCCHLLKLLKPVKLFEQGVKVACSFQVPIY